MVNRKRPAGQLRKEYRALQYEKKRLARELAKAAQRETTNPVSPQLRSDDDALSDVNELPQDEPELVQAPVPTVEHTNEPNTRVKMELPTVRSGLREFVRKYGLTNTQTKGLLDFFWNIPSFSECPS